MSSAWLYGVRELAPAFKSGGKPPHSIENQLMDAVRDGATLQVLYEGKTADTALNEKHQFDAKFEDLFRGRSEEELLAIKKKYGATGDILDAEQRIASINYAEYVSDIVGDLSLSR